MNRSIRHTFLTATAACGLWLAPATAQTTATTDPVGAMTVTINGGSPGYTAFSAPLLNKKLFDSSVESVSVSTVTFSGAPFVSGEFADQDPTGASLYYIEIEDGSAGGQILDIADNTDRQISIIVGDASLDSILAPGDKIAVRKYKTIAELFGQNNEVGLRSGPDSTKSDSLYIMKPGGGGDFNRYYYQTDNFGFLGGTGWRKFGDSSTNQADVRIDPDFGVMVVRDSENIINLTISGDVKTSKLASPLPAGLSFRGNMSPLGTTLGSSGLYKADGSGLAGGPDSVTADDVYILQSDGSWSRFYYQIDNFGFLGGTGWRLFGDPHTDRSGFVLGEGFALILSIKNQTEWVVDHPF